MEYDTTYLHDKTLCTAGWVCFQEEVCIQGMSANSTEHIFAMEIYKIHEMKSFTYIFFTNSRPLSELRMTTLS